MVRRYIISAILVFFTLATVSYSAEISISRINNAKSGERRTVTISADSIASQISGFNLLVAFDQSLGYVFAVRPGELHNSYGWEYFNYRLITRDTVAAHMPGYNVHLINLIGLASLSGAPPPSLNSGNVVLAELEVMLGVVIGSFSDETWIPFSFFWRDCNDNVLTSLAGDTVYAAGQLFENKSSFTPRDPVSFAFPGFGIPDSPCPPPIDEAVQQNIDFVNSGIWSFVIDPEWECYYGDVNLNGIPYEIDDVVLFISYFQFGIYILPWPPEVSIAQTECNCDGTVLSVADLVCFIRKAIGGHLVKIPVLSEGNIGISLREGVESKTVILDSDAELALTYFRFVAKGSERLNIEDLRFSENIFSTGQIGDTITMMLVDLEGNPVLSAGEHQLFEYTGSSEFEIQAWVVDMSGRETTMKIESATLPDSPELSQNYPNPFNPSTTIEFSLPSNTNWKLEIYNVTGQLIENFSGTADGATKIEWSGTDSQGVEVASGVYFYKLITAEQTSTRKMLLLK